MWLQQPPSHLFLGMAELHVLEEVQLEVAIGS